MPTASSSTPAPTRSLKELAGEIKRWGRELGFQKVGVTDTDLETGERHLMRWLARGSHGDMAYMERHGTRRSRPRDLVPGTVRVISLRADYLPPGAAPPGQVLENPNLGYISRYALGRDYHKVLRGRMRRLARRLERAAGPIDQRVFVDSAPVLEKALAEKAGLGWIGKHTNLLSCEAGSWFFLGEIYTNLALPVDSPADNHCGRCQACLDICPTAAITAPYRLDARRCISYLTIELHGSIPLEFRSAMGNRIYGCDDCQLVCPWNRFARHTEFRDFAVRHGLDSAALTRLFAWDETIFLRNTEGSAIRRIGHERWLRNIAIALGNAPTNLAVIAALDGRREHPSAMVREHVSWALQRHGIS